MMRTLISAVLFVLAVGAGISLAHDDDHERAREALAGGDVMPLAEILGLVLRDYPGQVLAVELENEDGRWVYELKVLLDDGALGRINVDARSGDVLDTRLRPPGPH